MKQQRDPQYLRCTPAGRLAVLTALLALLVSGSAWAAAPGSHHQHNHRNYDARGVENLTFKAAPNFEQKQAIDALRADVPGLAVTFDKTLGVTRSLYNTTGYLTEPSLEKAAPLAVGLGYVRSQLSTLGLTEADLAEFEVTDSVYSKLSGATHIYLRQTYQGIPVYNGQLHLNINRDGRVISINNAFVPNLGSALKSLAPSIGADEAVAAAGLHLEIPLKSMPAILAADAGPRQATRVAAKGLSLEEVNAELMWLPIRSGDVRLVWNFQIQTTDYDHWFDMTVDAETGKVWTRFDWVNSGDFRVYAEPDESPLHGSVGRTLVTDPEDATASPNGWFTGGTMSGNNVTACPDTSPANNSCDSNPQCSGTTCDFPVDLSQQPSSYVPAATANLFYWNNLIHDIQYQYGFDEAGGNFQENNFGNGGAGGDSVNADAQDGSGNCNANFATPTDGGNPRMQMFTCTNASPARDGDFDNGVIVHEYGHGISIRQVGGPGNSSCLNNTQQAGEGWSDLLGLIYTHEPGDAGTDSRGIGTYLFGQAPDGPGIRDLPYSTDPAVNNWTYESISGASIPHGVGSRWAQAAWEVYWVLVDEYGFEPDLHNFDINDANEAGNKRAKFYINEGLKNTACSPTFVDARDGIIQAATDNFGGADVCRMWEAFAAFGLGTDAVSGGSNSTSPTNGFSIPAACQCQPQPIADAGGDQTICLGDSTTVGTPAQPDNTYSWSPGGQTTAQITVSPAVDTTYTVTATTAACGSGSDSATVFVDDGTQAPGLSDDFEGDNSDWSATGLWHEVANSGCAAPENGYDSPVTAFYYGQDASCDYATGAATTGTLTSPTISGVTASSTLTFDYFRVVESFSGAFDQTEVDIVTSSGATTVFALDSSTASTAAWVSSGAISLSAFAGQQIQVVFRFNSGDGVANNFAGWFIDDVVVTGESQCAPVGCTSDLECDDGAFCNGSETCNLGTGVCEAGTPPVCGDGVSCTVDSCNESTDSCDNVTNDSLCDDGAFCNGSETCDAVNDCQPGTTVDCDDGVSCTADACNEGTDSCDSAPNDSLCDDGQFCNGSEVCDVVNDCQPGSDPCAGGACDEAADICVGCLVDADCSDGQFCNGVEVCNAGVCEAGPAVSCDDGVSCTVDSCNEGTDSCDNTADDSLCSDGLFCNGVETCDAVNDCQAGVDPCAGDETCNETADICEGTGANPTLWMSFRSPTAVPGVGTVDDEDVVSYDEITGVWSLEFDGSDVGLGGFEIDGLALLAGGDLLLSFRQAGTVGGLSVDDSDIVRFTPTSLGSNTAGSFSIYFDGSDVALTSNGEDVDGIALAADGRLIVSTQGGFSGTGASGADEDLFIFTGTLGTNTSGSFAQLFDGSDVGLGGVGAEDIDAAALTAAGNLLFSTIGNFDVGTLTGPDEDVVEFSGTFGSSTSGTFSTRQDLTGLGIAAGEDIGGLWIEE